MEGFSSQREELLSTPREIGTKKSARGQGQHLERLSEHLKQLQNDLLTEKVARQSSMAQSSSPLDARTGRSYTSKGLTPRCLTPRTATPRGLSIQGLQMEVARLKSELAAEKEAREATVGRALTSADEAAAAAQWAEAVTHENEKLHQLMEMQKAIINDLQKGNPMMSPIASKAENLSEKALAAKNMSQEACQLRASLLSRTGHAKALEQNLANLKEQSSRLRQNVGAKEAELAVVRAEAEALRRLHAIHTGTDGEAQNLPDDKLHQERLQKMQQKILERTVPIEEVWAEVKLGEERARILSAIAEASEVRVKILHEELCRAHAQTAACQDELSERDSVMREQTEAVAASAGAVANLLALEASTQELRKRLLEAEKQLKHMRENFLELQRQLEEAQGEAAALKEAKAGQQGGSAEPAASPAVERVVRPQQVSSPVPRIWQSAQPAVAQEPVRRSIMFPADPKRASLTSEHEAALISHRSSAERSGSLGANAVVTTEFIKPSADTGRGTASVTKSAAEVTELSEDRQQAAEVGRTDAETDNTHKSLGSAKGRGEKRDVRGQQKHATLAGSSQKALRQSQYTPVKLQDMAQLGAQPARLTPGSASARAAQTKEERWTPLTERRSISSPSPSSTASQAPWPALRFSPTPLHVQETSQAPLPVRSPLSEVQVPPCGAQLKQTLKNAEKSSPGSGLLRSQSMSQTPTAEACMSPQPRFAGTPGSDQLRRGQSGSGWARKAPAPRTFGAKRASYFNASQLAADADAHKVPDMEASLCNLHGSPLSPPDLHTADKARRVPAMSSLAFQSRKPYMVDQALQSTAGSPFQRAAEAPFSSCNSGPAKRPSGAQNGGPTRIAVPESEPAPKDGNQLVSPLLTDSGSTPRARGARPRVPGLNLSGSLRISVEAGTPPCSFPLRSQAVEAAITDCTLSAASARSCSSDESNEHFQVHAIYELAVQRNDTEAGELAQLEKPHRQVPAKDDGWGPAAAHDMAEKEEDGHSDEEGAGDGMPTGRSTEQAVYELGMPQASDGSSIILGETSTFLAMAMHQSERPNTLFQPLKELSEQLETADQVAASARAQAGESEESTPRCATKKGLSVFLRLAPLLKKQGDHSNEVTPRKAAAPAAETTPVKGLARLSPARWKWGACAAKTAAAETCSPLRDGAAAVTFPASGQGSRSGSSSPQKGSRRKLSSAKFAPWLGR